GVGFAVVPNPEAPKWKNKGHENPITEVRFTEDGRHLITSSSDALQVWTAGGGKRLARLTTSGGSLAFAIRPMHSSMAVWTRDVDQVVKIVSLETGKELERLRVDAAIRQVEFSPDAKMMAVATADGIVTYDVAQDALVSPKVPQRFKALAVRFSPSSKVL